MKKLFLVLFALLISISVVSCSSADRAAANLSKQAEEFRVLRRIVALNGFNNEPIYEIVGYCSVQSSESAVAGTMEITCKIGEDNFIKEYVYMADNVNIVVNQLEGLDVPQYHYQIIFTPQAILPIPEIITDDVGD